MRRWLQKLRARRGETLTETLVAVLVVALSSTLLATMITAASRQNARAMERDQALYAQLTTAEQRSGIPSSTGTVRVSCNGQSVDFEVAYYGGAEELTAYAPKEGPSS